MLPALGRYPFLSWAERAKVSRPALAMRLLDPADPAADTQRFGDWLAARGQSERARRALWDLFSVSALNIAGDDASLALAATVVKTGLLGKNNAADIGVPALPLGELHGDAAATVLAKLGAQVTLGAKVTAIEGRAIEGRAIEGRAIEGRAIEDGAIDVAEAPMPGSASASAGARTPTWPRTPWSWPSRTRRPPAWSRRVRCRTRRCGAGPGWAPRRSSTCT